MPLVKNYLTEITKEEILARIEREEKYKNIMIADGYKYYPRKKINMFCKDGIDCNAMG